MPRQRPPLDNASVSGIAGPRAPGTASANTATDGARLQSGCRCYITPGTRVPRRIRKFSREPQQPQWPGGQASGLESAIFAARPPSLTFTPDWSRRLPKICLIIGSGGQDVRQPGGKAIAWLSLVPPFPMGPQTPSRPTSSSPTDQARFQWGLQQRGGRKTSITSQPQPKAPRVATDTGKMSLNDDPLVLERGRAEPSAAVDSAPPFSRVASAPGAS